MALPLARHGLDVLRLGAAVQAGARFDQVHGTALHRDPTGDTAHRVRGVTTRSDHTLTARWIEVTGDLRPPRSLLSPVVVSSFISPPEPEHP